MNRLQYKKGLLYVLIEIMHTRSDTHELRCEMSGARSKAKNNA